MDAYEKIGYSILGTVALLWIVGMIAGAIAALPYGLIGLLAFVGVGAQSIDRMVEEADGLGADAIVCMRFTTSPVMQGAAELLAYGTAVKVRRRSIEI